jgi:hypothetical protein
VKSRGYYEDMGDIKLGRACMVIPLDGLGYLWGHILFRWRFQGKRAQEDELLALHIILSYRLPISTITLANTVCPL